MAPVASSNLYQTNPQVRGCSREQMEEIDRPMEMTEVKGVFSSVIFVCMPYEKCET